MFKKKCKKCGRKINERYEFCPYCGNSPSKNHREEDWGVLGKNDFIPSFNEIRMPIGFNAVFNSLMKNLDKQFRNLDSELGKTKKEKAWKGKIRKGGISISISTFGDSPPKIKVRSFGNVPEFEQQKKIRDVKIPSLSKENLRKLTDLPKKEPSTNIRRLANRIIYEIDMPGVKSIKDISIIKLENSIEIKAIAKDKAYFKLIPLNFPIINYNLSQGKLILELADRI